jgi:hypothetical protein
MRVFGQDIQARGIRTMNRLAPDAQEPQGWDDSRA